MTPLFLFILLTPLYLEVNSADLSFEQKILLSLKQPWGNPKSLDSWNSTSPLCDWPGVECTSGTVTGLHLAEKNISGTIPSSICQLINLISINLAKNNISGQIPVGLYNCLNLERLDLSLNKLSGTIPGELFTMKTLHNLNLQGNRLSGTIPTPMEAHNLEYLDLSDNNLSGYMPEGLGLFSLQVLNLTHNNLKGTIPKSLGNLTVLSDVDLSHNQLSGDIVESLYDLGCKRTLRLCSNNFLGRIPYEFVKQNIGENCLDPSNLCSDNRTEGLQSCPPNLGLDDRILGFRKCNSKAKSDESERQFIIIIVETVGAGVVGCAILYYLVRKILNKMHWNITVRCKTIGHSVPPGEKEEWKVISFQKLKFSKNEILSGLTDENLIGGGGSGKVYRVSINQTGESVAVKSIRNASKSDQRREKEFMAEIQTVGNVRHYNIVKLLCCISGWIGQ
ncbi:Non-specific serine/threonine protein kinase [Handroanthus impetiginosus]|uniref:Non-specific serine/threonine protein kinase n=1 Tax=Handroanthus impetiginosus TaxID=429701 RepID=A0A2G9I4N4_9LAMI|nr:Non-specific serine/threonine protein kinase [Handroanthus impetiginosus]